MGHWNNKNTGPGCPHLKFELRSHCQGAMSMYPKLVQVAKPLVITDLSTQYHKAPSITGSEELS